MPSGLSNESICRVMEGMFYGSLMAGLYGVLHDQITYTLGREYFTENKFIQFSAFDFGWSNRGFVALIGFLATWWVGCFAGWALVRCTGVYRQSMHWRSSFFQGVFVMIGIAMLAGLAAYIKGEESEFDLVQSIHSASYFGGVVGLFVALIYLRRKLRLSTDPDDFVES